MASDYPYAAVPSKLKEFLEKIRGTGVPPKATYNWLETIGFKSKNDRTVITVVKFIGFIDASSQPSNYWVQYRGSGHKRVLAEAIKQGYSELFSIYPEANKLSETDLEHFFTTKSTAGKQVISRLVRTFITLCELADFQEITPSSPNILSQPTPPQVVSTTNETFTSFPAQTVQVQQNTPTLHIDIQIHISPESSPEQIDQIFASMAKHLYKKNE
jgi:hypothetical protein